MGGLAHGLRAAREHRVGLAQQDELRALRDRLEARAAQPVDRHGGHLDREARLETDVAGAVDRIRRGLERVAEDGVAHLGRRHVRALERVLRRDRAKLDRREVLERAAERAEARADAGEEDDVFMGTLGFHGGSSALDRGISGEWGKGCRATVAAGLHSPFRRASPFAEPTRRSAVQPVKGPCLEGTAMKWIRETPLVLALIGCSDLPGPAPREAAGPNPPPLVLQSGGLYCTEPGAQLSSGALYKVCVDPAKWNRDIVVFIPGYHDPADAPSLPDDFSETPVSLLFSTLGYGFASTSFRGTGLIERATWVGGDLLELVETAKTLLANSTGRTARFVYQTGGSQGGLGTVMAVEQYPNTFSGGLAGCGPIGDYRRQIDYVADFRVVFDHYFADVIPGWPVWKQD